MIWRAYSGLFYEEVCRHDIKSMQWFILWGGIKLFIQGRVTSIQNKLRLELRAQSMKAEGRELDFHVLGEDSSMTNPSICFWPFYSY